ncbi:hypothetical protein NFI96_010899, partial [Prochilodus magdalenae]
VSTEFEQIRTVSLLSRFFSKLDPHSAKLLKVFAKRGGVQGRKIMQVSDVAAIQRGIEESWVSMQPELRELKPWTSMQMLK